MPNPCPLQPVFTCGDGRCLIRAVILQLSAMYLNSIGIRVPENFDVRDVRLGNNIETITFLYDLRVQAATCLRAALQAGQYIDFNFPEPDLYDTAEDWFTAYNSDCNHGLSSTLWKNGSVWELVAVALLLKVSVYVHRYEQDANSGIWIPRGCGNLQGGDGTGLVVNIAQQYRQVTNDETNEASVDLRGNPVFETFHFEGMLTTEDALRLLQQSQHQQQPHQPTDQQLKKPQQDLEPQHEQQQKLVVRDGNVYMCTRCKKTTQLSVTKYPRMKCPCGKDSHACWSMCTRETEVTSVNRKAGSWSAGNRLELPMYRGASCAEECRGVFYTSQDFYPPPAPNDPSHTTAALEPGVVPGYIPTQEHSSYVVAVDNAKKRIPDWKPTMDDVVTHAILIFVSNNQQINEALNMDTDALLKQVS